MSEPPIEMRSHAQRHFAKPNVLFLCSRNRLRSPTAEQVFASREDIECTSAGLNRDAENPVTPDLVAWADLIFVMEKRQLSKLRSTFRAQLSCARVICLDIPDDYDYMQPELIHLLQTRITPFLPPVPGTGHRSR